MICFELINTEYHEIKRINNITSIKKIPNSNNLFCAINFKKNIELFEINKLELINVLYKESKDICFLNNKYFITVDSFSNTSILSLFDLRKFKKLDDFVHPSNAYMNRLIKIGKKRYFIVGNQSNVSSPSIYEIYNNKINYIMSISLGTLPFTSWLFFNNIIFIGGNNSISTFKFDIQE